MRFAASLLVAGLIVSSFSASAAEVDPKVKAKMVAYLKGGKIKNVQIPDSAMTATTALTAVVKNPEGIETKAGKFEFGAYCNVVGMGQSLDIVAPRDNELLVRLVRKDEPVTSSTCPNGTLTFLPADVLADYVLDRDANEKAWIASKLK